MAGQQCYWPRKCHPPRFTSRTQILHAVPRNVALIKSPCYKFVPRLCGFTARANSGDKRQEFSSMPPIRRLNMRL